MGLKDDIAGEEIGPKRDRWGRPLLVPLEASLQGEADVNGRTWYSRASSLSDYASGVKTGLETWKRRNVAVGLARREDVAAMLAALPDMETGDKKSDAVTKAQVDEYIDMAFEASGAVAKANWGTAIHGFTADGNAEHAPERMKADIAAYEAELERLGIRPVLSEVFVASDGLRAAGTFDHLYQLPDGRVVVGDKKTGVKNYLDAAIQMSVYVTGDVYDWRTDTRESLEIVGGSFGDFDPSVALYVSIPRGEATCEVTLLDMYYAYDLALHCAELRDAGHSARKDLLIAQTSTGIFLERIYACDSRAELQELMAGVEDDDVKKAARFRWNELGS